MRRMRVTTLLVLMVALLVPMTARAQEEDPRMNRVYLMPMIFNGPPSGESHQAKYRSTYNVNGVSSAVLTWGAEPWALVFLRDVPTSVHQTLIGFADVYGFSENIDQIVGANQQEIESEFETATIPADWINPQQTIRSALRTVAVMCLFTNRLVAENRPGLFAEGTTLNTRWNQLSVARQTAMLTTATEQGYSTAVMSGNATMRLILKNLADQRVRFMNFAGFIL